MKSLYAILAVLFLLLTSFLFLLDYSRSPNLEGRIGKWLPSLGGNRAHAAELGDLRSRQGEHGTARSHARLRYEPTLGRRPKPGRVAARLRDPLDEPTIRQVSSDEDFDHLEQSLPDDEPGDFVAPARPPTSADDGAPDLPSALDDQPQPRQAAATRSALQPRQTAAPVRTYTARDSDPSESPENELPASSLDPPAAADAPLAPRPATPNEPARLSPGFVARALDHEVVSLRWVTPDEVNVGQAATCQLIVHNSGEAAAQEVAIRATLPEHVELEHAVPEPNRDAQELTWAIGQLAPGETQTVELELTPLAEGEVTPTALVTFTRATAARIQVLRAELRLAIEGPRAALVGEPAVCQFVVTNVGAGRAQNVIVETDLDLRLRPRDLPSPSYVLGALAPGESRSVQISIIGSAPGSCDIAATVFAGTTATAECRERIDIVSPGLELAIEGPRLRYVERPAAYTIKVHNPGPATVNNIQVFDLVPPGFRFIEASAGGTFDGPSRQVAWFLGSLPPRETAEVTVQLAATEPGERELQAEVRADAGVAAQAQTATRVEAVSMVALDVVDSDDPVEVDGETTYELRVTNRGSRPAEGVQVAARFPEQMDLVDHTGPTTGRPQGQQIVFEPLAALAPGKTEVYRVRMHCSAAGQVGFRAYFRTAEHPEAVAEDELTRVYQD